MARWQPFHKSHPTRWLPRALSLALSLSLFLSLSGQGNPKNNTVIPSATDVWTLNAAGTVVSHTSAYILSEPRKKLASAAHGNYIAFATGYSDAGNAKNTGCVCPPRRAARVARVCAGRQSVVYRATRQHSQPPAIDGSHSAAAA